MSAKEYEILSRITGCNWYCPYCSENVHKNLDASRQIEEKCKEYLSEFTKRLEKVENELEKKCDKTQVKSMVEEEVRKLDIGNKPEEEKKELLDCTVREMKERKEREGNLLIYNLAECESENNEERKEYDKNCLKEIFKEELELKWTLDDEIVYMKRIKRKDESAEEEEDSEAEKSPPALRIKLKDPAKKPIIFKNLNKLKETRYKNISIRNDLTIMERLEYKKLMAEGKKKEEESNGEAKYRVRGPPWNLKLVKLKAKK
jgi:hypothetical protein